MENTQRYELMYEKEGILLVAGEKQYLLSCHPYEPCLYIRTQGRMTVLHNAFDPERVKEAFENGRTVEAVTGTAYDLALFGELVVYAAAHFSETDIGYAGGKLAVEKLKALGALDERTAVFPAKTGIAGIDSRFSHAAKLEEKVMYTPDGRVYVRIRRGLSDKKQ